MPGNRKLQTKYSDAFQLQQNNAHLGDTFLNSFYPSLLRLCRRFGHQNSYKTASKTDSKDEDKFKCNPDDSIDEVYIGIMQQQGSLWQTRAILQSNRRFARHLCS